MPKTNINQVCGLSSDSAIELLAWPVGSKAELKSIKNEVIALQTTRFTPEQNSLAGASPAKPFVENNQSVYHSFNLGLHVDDNVQTVSNNRDYLQNFLQSKLTNKVSIQWLEQVHGSEVVEVTRDTNQTLIADASITREKHIALAIMTADCLPILLCDTNRTIVAAIHGGWRPLAAGIIKNTLAKMRVDIDNIQAWLGPCIGNRAFEVGDDVKLAFIKQNVCFEKAFSSHKKGKYLADLHAIATQQLTDLGITKISSLAECTYSRSDKYYSYRRESITGRMATIICLS